MFLYCCMFIAKLLLLWVHFFTFYELNTDFHNVHIVYFGAFFSTVENFFESQVLHTDQGVHYTSNQYIQLLETTNIQRSMSRRGNCWDNAPQESFFGHMKDEISEKIKGCDPIEIKKIINDLVDYYNNDRCIWKLNKLPPKLYYQSLLGVLPLGEDGCLYKQSIN